MKINCFDGHQKDLVKDIESEWPDADKEHYGDSLPNFNKSDHTLIAYENDIAIGFIFMSIDTGVATIDSILVRNAFRNKGIGTDLLKEAETKAIEKKCHVIKLETGKDWGAKSLYESQGYELRAELKEYYGKYDFVLMDKRL